MEQALPQLAILAPYPFWPARSGGHRAIAAYLRYLAAQWPTICLGATENEPFPGVEMIPLFTDRPSKYIDPRVGWRIRQLVKERDIRFLGLQHHYHGLLLRPFLLGLEVDVFVFSHNLEFERWRSIGKWWWPLMKWTETFVYRWAQAVFFISWQESLRAPAVFGLPPDNCFYAPYPIDQASSPAPVPGLAQEIKERHGFAPNDKLLLFFGPQSYAPNLQAVEDIVYRIHPLLYGTTAQPYRIIICGGGLPARFEKFNSLQKEGIHYLGFVEKIEEYVLAADLILNPVNLGGGVKTKLVEAIALGKTVISSKTGALGVRPAAFGEKLIQIDDEDWQGFANCIKSCLEVAEAPTPESFYQEHYGPQAVAPIVAWMRRCLEGG